MLLKNCKYIVTQDKERRILRYEDIKIDGNKITEIGHNIAGEGHKIIDCSKKIVMPGLINTHAHLGMHSLKGICDDEKLFDWLTTVMAEEDKLTEEQILINTKHGAEESIRYGTTCIYDSYKFAAERKAVFEKLGMRAFLSSTVRKEKHLKHVQRLLDVCNGFGIVHPIIAAHSPYGCTEPALKMIIKLSNKHKVMRRIHIAETKKEVDDLLENKGIRAVEYLDSIGFLDEMALLVHCTWVDDKEIDMIAKNNCSVSHNPISNMKLASGHVTPVVKMIEKGINVGLGTDSVVSNNNLDMFEEMKTAALLHKHHNNNPKAMRYQDVLDMATINAARCLGMPDVGSIQKGWIADIITLDMHGLKPVNNLVSNLVYCAHGDNVCDSIIDGRVIFKDKEFV